MGSLNHCWGHLLEPTTWRKLLKGTICGIVQVWKSNDKSDHNPDVLPNIPYCPTFKVWQQTQQFIHAHYTKLLNIMCCTVQQQWQADIWSWECFSFNAHPLHLTRLHSGTHCSETCESSGPIITHFKMQNWKNVLISSS